MGDRIDAVQTEQRRELLSLGSAEQAFRLLDGVTDAVFSFDARWNYTYLNDAAYDLLGLVRETLIGRNAWQTYPEMRSSENALVLQHCMREREGLSWSAYSRVAKAWFQWRVFPIADEGLALIVTNIDARVRAERAQAQSERRFHALTDLVPCMIWMSDATGRTSWCNQRLLEYCGLALADAQNALFDTVHADDADAARRCLTAAAATHSPARCELRLRSRDGSYRWHASEMRPVAGEDGQIAYWLGAATDVQVVRDALTTEHDLRRDAEDLRDHYHRVLSQAPLALAVFRGPEHVLEAATAQACEFYGSNLPGHKARELLCEAALQRGVLDRLTNVYVSGSACTIKAEAVGLAADPPEYVLDTCYTALRRGDGEVYGVMVTSVDVTAQAHTRKHEARERERLARVLEQAPFAVAVTYGPDHILKSANERQRLLFGQRATLNLPLRASFPERELEPVHALFDRVFLTREPIVLREQHIGWDRTGAGERQYGYFDLIYQPITDAYDRVEGLLCVSTDVTDSVTARLAVSQARDESERARAEAEGARQHLGQIVEAIPTAIAVTRGADHVYDVVNSAYLRLAGWRELTGRPVREAFPEMQSDGFIEILDRVYKDGAQVQLPDSRAVYTRQVGGGLYEGYFTVSLAPLRTRDNRIIGIVAAGIEVTEQVHQRARNEALRQEAEQAHGALAQAHAELEQRIAERTRELARANAELGAEIAVRREAESGRRELQRRLARAREDEQRRTARDLHDQVGQTLSALMLAIKTACESAPLPETIMTRLTDALHLAEDLGRDIHQIATRLRPSVLDHFGLHSALRQLLLDWSKRCGKTVDFEGEWVKDKRYPADVETTLYRVTQEALTNVARHAHATHVSVVVERSSDQLICVVEDNGTGFDVSTMATGRMGLESMRERALLVGGSLEVESAPGAGTTVIVTIPLHGVSE